MTTDELIRALRNTDWSDSCPCEHEHLCKNADCIIIQAADRLENLDEADRAARMGLITFEEE